MKFVNIESGIERTHVFSGKGFTLTDKRTGIEFTMYSAVAITADTFVSDNWDENKTGSIIVTFRDFNASSANWVSNFINHETGDKYVVVRD